MIRRLRTIDAHVGGQPVRLVVDGLPEPEGDTMAEKRAWLARRADRLRRALLLEPRGRGGMGGGVLTKPTNPGADAGLLSMHGDGFGLLSIDVVLAVATIAFERDLIPTALPGVLVLDTPAGRVGAAAREISSASSSRPSRAAARQTAIAVQGAPSFVLHAGVPVRLGVREVTADVAFGGEFYAIVDAEAAGLPLSVGRLDDLREAGIAIRKAVQAACDVRHPAEPGIGGIHGTIFTGPSHEGEADLRAVAVVGSGQVDRSPCASAMCAIAAVIDRIGLFDGDKPFRQEGLLGSTLAAKVIRRDAAGDIPVVVPEIEGRAWITGEHLFLVDDNDPFKHGFTL
jgi:proline racemase